MDLPWGSHANPRRFGFLTAPPGHFGERAEPKPGTQSAVRIARAPPPRSLSASRLCLSHPHPTPVQTQGIRGAWNRSPLHQPLPHRRRKMRAEPQAGGQGHRGSLGPQEAGPEASPSCRILAGSAGLLFIPSGLLSSSTWHLAHRANVFLRPAQEEEGWWLLGTHEGGGGEGAWPLLRLPLAWAWDKERAQAPPPRRVTPSVPSNPNTRGFPVSLPQVCTAQWVPRRAPGLKLGSPLHLSAGDSECLCLQQKKSQRRPGDPGLPGLSELPGTL